MIEIGNYNTLYIKYITPDGVTLTDRDEEVYLPPNNILEKRFEVGDAIEVFVFQDKQGKLIATTKQINATVNSFAYLKVVDENAHGAFMGMGTDKDLFVPKAEQRFPLQKGKSYVVYLFIDKLSKRLTGSTKLNRFVKQQPEGLAEKQEVELLISEETDLGYNAIINNEYKGLIYENEVFQSIRVGQKLKGWIKRFTHEGKIDLSLQPMGYSHVLDSREIILDALRKAKGTIPLGDKSSPEEIHQRFNISKNTFKRSIGSLYKDNLITLSDNEIRLVSAD